MQSHVFSFSDPDDYQVRIQASQAEILTSSRGEFRAELALLRFERLWMQRGADNLPRIARTTIDPARAAVMFVADAQQGSTTLGGHELAPGFLGLYGKGTTNVARTEGGSRWACMSLPHEDLARMGEALCGRELTCPSDTHLIRPPAEAMSRLMSIHARAIDAARTTPGVLANPAAAKALEQELVQALIACLGAGAPGEQGSASRYRARIVTRFQDFLESRPGEPLYLAEICSAIGASERTLRTCCKEMLGVGPVRYLWLRRMHLTRQALLHADAAATVTEIATSQGFWELGRFSVEYRTLFGETPSATLRQPPDRKAVH